MISSKVKIIKTFNERLVAILSTSLFLNNSIAKCVYDAELGIERDDQSLLMLVTFLLVLVIILYPLKDWSNSNPLIATTLVIAAPVIVGLIGSGRC